MFNLFLIIIVYVKSINVGFIVELIWEIIIIIISSSSSSSGKLNKPMFAASL